MVHLLSQLLRLWLKGVCVTMREIGGAHRDPLLLGVTHPHVRALLMCCWYVTMIFVCGGGKGCPGGVGGELHVYVESLVYAFLLPFCCPFAKSMHFLVHAILSCALCTHMIRNTPLPTCATPFSPQLSTPNLPPTSSQPPSSPHNHTGSHTGAPMSLCSMPPPLPPGVLERHGTRHPPGVPPLSATPDTPPSSTAPASTMSPPSL